MISVTVQDILKKTLVLDIGPVYHSIDRHEYEG